jgi:hypothetical protein
MFDDSVTMKHPYFLSAWIYVLLLACIPCAYAETPLPLASIPCLSQQMVNFAKATGTTLPLKIDTPVIHQPRHLFALLEMVDERLAYWLAVMHQKTPHATLDWPKQEVMPEDVTAALAITTTKLDALDKAGLPFGIASCPLAIISAPTERDMVTELVLILETMLAIERQEMPWALLARQLQWLHQSTMLLTHAIYPRFMPPVQTAQPVSPLPAASTASLYQQLYHISHRWYEIVELDRRLTIPKGILLEATPTSPTPTDILVLAAMLTADLHAIAVSLHVDLPEMHTLPLVLSTDFTTLVEAVTALHHDVTALGKHQP